MNQISWNACCSEREFLIKNGKYDNKYDWITGDDYTDSRSKVVGKAIGDCVAEKNEFANKKPGDVITFGEDTHPEMYKQKHWNAVILYNYVHEAINNKETLESEPNWLKYLFTVKEALASKFSSIKTYYTNCYTRKYGEDANKLFDELFTKLDQAVEIVQKYVDALNLRATLYAFNGSKWKYEKSSNSKDLMNIAPGANTLPSDNNVIMLQCFYKSNIPESSYFRTCIQPTFRCCKDDLYLSDVKIFEEYWGKKKETEQSQRWCYTKGSTIRVTYEDLKKQARWLLSRLAGLIVLPLKELWDRWHSVENAA